MSDTEDPSRFWRVLSMALSIFIVSVALLWLSRENGPPPFQPVKRERNQTPKLPPREPAERGERPAPRERMDATARAAALERLPPLPAAETKLSEQLAVLTERAMAADPVAGCRLVLAAARCRRGAADDRFCADIDATDLPSANRVLQRAQGWMTPRQKVLMAMMRSDGAIVRLVPTPGFAGEAGGYVYPQFLAEHAYEFLLEGFRAYDPLALEGLALVHAPSSALGWRGTGPALPNPRLYAFYVGVLERLHGPGSVGDEAREAAAQARATLAPAARERLEHQIETEASQWLEAETPEVAAARWQALQREDLRLEDCAP